MYIAKKIGSQNWSVVRKGGEIIAVGLTPTGAMTMVANLNFELFCRSNRFVVAAQ